MGIREPLLVLTAGLLGACGAAEPDPTFELRPAQIDEVEVLILESFPARAAARIAGVLGDGCTELAPIEQTRDGDEIVLSVLARRPAGAVCVQVATTFEERVALDGSFAPGSYLLRVNDVSVVFRVD